MHKALFKYVANGFVDCLTEYDNSEYVSEEFKDCAAAKDYKGILDIFTSDIYHYYKPDYDELSALFGNVNLFIHIYSYNKPFYSYLLERLKANKAKQFKLYAKYLNIVLKSDLKEINYGDIINVLFDPQKGDSFRISYIDKSNNVSERIISKVSFYLDAYGVGRSKVNAHCHLRNEERNFLLHSIQSCEKLN